MMLVDPELLDGGSTDLSSVSARLALLRASVIPSLFQLYRPDAAAAVDAHLTSAVGLLTRLASDLAYRAQLGRDLARWGTDQLDHENRVALSNACTLADHRASRDHPMPGSRDALPQTLRQVWAELVELDRLSSRLAAAEEPSPAHAVRSHLRNRRADLTSELTVADWRVIAQWEAGIDPNRWRTELGLSAIEEIVLAVYAFYGDLYLSNRDFQWAGMANLVAPLFYGGWRDLTALRHFGDPPSRLVALTRMASARGTGLPVSSVIGIGVLAARELAWLEVQMLDMQKQIFEDLAWMHVAYRYGGPGAVSTHLDDPTLIDAWDDIASGDPSRVAAGNEALLRREQFAIVQDDYERIAAHHGLVGSVLADALTWMADAPFPGSNAYREVVTNDITLPGVEWANLRRWPEEGWLPIETTTAHVSVPRGQVTTFADRWEWIDSDLLPAYHRLIGRAGAVEALIRTPVVERMPAFRLAHGVLG
jgi:hypothetical protein